MNFLFSCCILLLSIYIALVTMFVINCAFFFFCKSFSYFTLWLTCPVMVIIQSFFVLYIFWFIFLLIKWKIEFGFFYHFFLVLTFFKKIIDFLLLIIKVLFTKYHKIFNLLWILCPVFHKRINKVFFIFLIFVIEFRHIRITFLWFFWGLLKRKILCRFKVNILSTDFSFRLVICWIS